MKAAIRTVGRPAPDRMCRAIHRRRARNQAPGGYDECRSLRKICFPALQPGIRKIQSLLRHHFSHPGRSPLLPPQPTHRGHTRRIAHRRLHHRLHRHFPQPPDHHPQNTLQSAAHPSKKDLPERMMLPPPSERLHFKRPSVSVYSDQ